MYPDFPDSSQSLFQTFIEPKFENMSRRRVPVAVCCQHEKKMLSIIFWNSILKITLCLAETQEQILYT